VSSSWFETMRMALFAPKRRKVPGVSKTSARPSAVRSSEPLFIWPNLPVFCSTRWSSRKTEPSEK
jgi:hypothetical protein